MVQYELTLGKQVVDVDFDPEARTARVGKKDYKIETTEYGPRVIVDVDGKNFSIELIQGRVFVNGEQVNFTIQKARPALLGKRKEALAAKGARVQTPMPGRIVSVMVKAGQKVSKGQGVVVLEAMKMQNELTAPVDGLVKAVHCKEGDNVEQAKVLIEIE
jgi:pyruvate carboxylase subunit B